MRTTGIHLYDTFIRYCVPYYIIRHAHNAHAEENNIMTELTIYNREGTYTIASEWAANPEKTTGAPQFRLVIESEEDLLSLPANLFDDVMDSIRSGRVWIDEVTASINTLLHEYSKGFPKPAPGHEVI